jgi:putative transposase
MILAELTAEQWVPSPRCTEVLRHLDIATSSGYRPRSAQRKRPAPAPQPIPQEIVDAVITMATDNPWYGYKKIAVMCRRAGQAVKNRVAYLVMREHRLLHRRRSRAAEVYQAARLFELLPRQPNDLWQMDVTYIHIPGHGWWYAVTVIDYSARYLLACYLTDSDSALEVGQGWKLARAEAERIHGPLPKRPFLVTDNGPWFLARRFVDFVREWFRHVRIRYRTPQPLGLLERFHETLKTEEVPWRLYEDPEHARRCLGEFRGRYNTLRPHWALVPEGGGDVLVPAEVYAGGRAIQIPRWQAWARAARAKRDALWDEVA